MTNPVTPPIKSVGPNVPPTPPPAFVKEIAQSLKNIIVVKKKGDKPIILNKDRKNTWTDSSLCVII